MPLCSVQANTGPQNAEPMSLRLYERLSGNQTPEPSLVCRIIDMSRLEVNGCVDGLKWSSPSLRREAMGFRKLDQVTGIGG